MRKFVDYINLYACIPNCVLLILPSYICWLCNVNSYSQLSSWGHPAIMDTSLLGTVSNSPAKTIIKCIEITLGIVDSSCGPTKHIYCSTLVTTDTLDALFSIYPTIHLGRGQNTDSQDFGGNITISRRQLTVIWWAKRSTTVDSLLLSNRYQQFSKQSSQANVITEITLHNVLEK